jgi:segregation and condensation protein A
MEELDLDQASEYLLMAATLAHIKSKMLLPQNPTLETAEEQDDAYLEDPRAELIRRLLEYQKYKAAAEHLGSRPMAGRDVFPRGMPAPAAQGPAPLAGIDMFKLLDAFQTILKRVQGRVALEVTAERITIHERMSQLADLLRVKRACTFDDLFEHARTRYEVVVTFLALLEMTKLRMTRISQDGPQSLLLVEYALLDDVGSVNEAKSTVLDREDYEDHEDDRDSEDQGDDYDPDDEAPDFADDEADVVQVDTESPASEHEAEHETPEESDDDDPEDDEDDE